MIEFKLFKVRMIKLGVTQRVILKALLSWNEDCSQSNINSQHLLFYYNPLP